jgi:hypothetical protein
MLSLKKQEFLNASEQSNFALSSDNIRAVVKHYQNKKIEIQLMDESFSNNIDSRTCEEIIKLLKDEKFKYAIYVRDFLIKSVLFSESLVGIHISFMGSLHSNFSDAVPLITSIIDNTSKFLVSDSMLLPNTRLRLTELNTSFIGLFKKFSSLKEMFDQKINLYIRCLEDSLSEQKNIFQKIQTIRNRGNSVVGCILKGSEHLHSESFLLTRSGIIKPLCYTQDLITQDSVDELFTTNLKVFIKSGLSTYKLPFPQADTISCSSLGLAYLKKLLKENAKALDSSLIISFYLDRDRKVNFFLPHPCVLCYSQSSRYINFLKGILSKGSEFTYQGNQFFTLTYLLTQSIAFARAKNDNITADENNKRLKQLPDFCNQWLDCLEKIECKRQTMHVGNRNHYLNYTRTRYSMFLPLSETDKSLSNNSTYARCLNNQ